MAYIAKKTKFDYESIPAGYYHDVLEKGNNVQKFWHSQKFQYLIDIIKAENISSKSLLVDVGTGPGTFLFMLNKQLPNIICEGVDISSNQIEFAQNKTDELQLSNLKFIKVDNEKLPYADNSVDIVTTVEVAEHLLPYQAMKTAVEVKRILKPNGKWIVTTPNYRSLWPIIEVGLNFFSPVKYQEQHISKFTPNSLVKFVESGGFDVIDVRTLFFLAPFYSFLSKKLAKRIMNIENSMKFPGSLLVCICTPIRE
ncbi:MAG: class I SAM-dependent methyltransferase [Bacteroidales bacterium]|jgi:2-polyprenyl-3-methyl-5-hydroxy-6-metoxy-1,4-benzoquinol methylase|nr:class I SAM-dependent methyltransferase [Bacteroidales bacterium]